MGEQCAVQQRQPHVAHDATSTPPRGSDLDEAGSEELDEGIVTTSAQLRARGERGGSWADGEHERGATGGGRNWQCQFMENDRVLLVITTQLTSFKS